MHRKPRNDIQRDSRDEIDDRNVKYRDRDDRREKETCERNVRPSHPKSVSPDASFKAKSESPINLDDLTEEEQMKMLIGSVGFNSTKGKSVPGKDMGAVNITKKVGYFSKSEDIVQASHEPTPVVRQKANSFNWMQKGWKSISIPISNQSNLSG